MKAWMLVLSLVALMSFTGLADAKGKHGNGIRGTIVSVTGNTFTMTLHAKKSKTADATAPAAPATVTVDATAATITGALAPGAKVEVVGSQNGDKITATAVTVHTGHKKKST
jgi:RNase P/RNase MRP subunit p29